jgi:hypothetical protein
MGIKKVGFVLPAASGLYEIVGDTTALIVGARALKNSGDPKRAEYKEELDLAVMELPPKVVDTLTRQYNFLDLRTNQPPEKPAWTLVAGYPASENQFDMENQVCNFSGCWRVCCPVAIDREVRKIKGLKDFILP